MVGGPGRILGVITPHEIKGVARDRWASTPLSDVMRPIGQLRTAQPDMLAIDALTLMGREDVNQLPVVSPAPRLRPGRKGYSGSFVRSA